MSDSIRLVFNRPAVIDGRAFKVGDFAGEMSLTDGLPLDRFINGVRSGDIVEAPAVEPVAAPVEPTAEADAPAE